MRAFTEVLRGELERVDAAALTKREERVIEGFSEGKAVIAGKEYSVFNANDYLGLRHHALLKKAEREASERYGAGPGGVRFISGTLQVHKELERELAAFHGREDAILFSSAFAANLAVLHCLLKGQSKDAVLSDDVLVVSDELNHRSIIDGVRVAGCKNKQVFKHKDLDDLERILKEYAGKVARVVIVTDGVFSMLGEYQDVKKVQEIAERYEEKFVEGIITVVDDCHGVGCFGRTGRGCEEVTSGTCDVLVGTMGKAFGADGGYVVGSKVLIEYLRESAATYIYSNPIAPGTAGAALAAVKVVQEEGKKLLHQLEANIRVFKQEAERAGLMLAADSEHAIQPLLVGDAAKTRALTEALYERGFLVTGIQYPVVPKGRDELRIQLCAVHASEEIKELVKKIKDLIAADSNRN